MAEVMCHLLGYTYGRTYLSPEVTYRAPNNSATYVDAPLGYLYCDPASPPGDSDAAAGRRRLHAPLTGSVDVPANAPYTCAFRQGDCGFAGPLAGVECSFAKLPPAPPPLPSPPQPPPRPPSYQTAIRTHGGGYNNEYLEDNLCALSDNPRGYKYCQRAELLVPDPANATRAVWAQLCSPRDAAQIYKVADLACKQFVDWPYTSLAQIQATPYKPIPIPQGPQPDGSAVFRPELYSFWVEVQGVQLDGKTAVQQLQLQVSSNPCVNGLLVYTCTYADD